MTANAVIPFDELPILFLLIGLAALVCAAGYFLCSPMPIVRLLRRGGDAPSGWPAGEEDALRWVEVFRDLPYASPYGRNTYDLYLLRERTNQPLPVVVWVHGGAFVAGSKSGVANWASCLADRGMAVAAVEYQWAPEAHWPAQVEQIGQCVGALAGDPRLDLGRVAIAGDSAGAHMAAQFALIHTSPAFREDTGLEPVLAPGALRGALLLCGPYDIGQMARPKSRFLRIAMHRIGWSYLGRRRWRDTPQAKATVIRDYVTGDFPPAFITDGNTGSFESQGKALAEALGDAGVRVDGLFFPAEEGEISHEYQFRLDRPEGRRCYQRVLTFLEEAFS